MGKNAVHGRKKEKKKNFSFLSRFYGNNFAFIRNIINKTDKIMKKKKDLLKFSCSNIKCGLIVRCIIKFPLLYRSTHLFENLSRRGLALSSEYITNKFRLPHSFLSSRPS